MVFAPGQDLTAATQRGSFWDGFDGTSFAAPHVTAAVVLAQQLAEDRIGRRLTIDELQRLLVTDNTRTVNDPMTSTNYKVFNLDEFLTRVHSFTAPAASPDGDAPDSREDAGFLASAPLSASAFTGARGVITDIAAAASGLAKPADLDWYKVTLTPGQWQIILRGEDDSRLDPFLEVYLPSVDQSFRNDDHHLTTAPVSLDVYDAALTLHLHETQDVYLRASASPYSIQETAKTGAYRFFLNRTSPRSSVSTLTSTAQMLTLASFEVELLRLTGLTAGETYTLRYKFTPVAGNGDGLADVIQSAATLADFTASGLYQKIEARLTSADGRAVLPLALHVVPNGPDAPADHYGFSGFVSTSFTAPRQGIIPCGWLTRQAGLGTIRSM